MSKSLYIAEKPSVAQEFAKALKENFTRRDGYLESAQSVVTWCVGHLITMSYPEAYDPSLKRWSLATLPFLPEEFRYEVIDSVKKQYGIVSGLLKRKDVDVIYVCTDSGREGEYIYRLVEQMAGVSGKDRRRVWIDSQTEEEILRGIREAKDLSEYDHLSDSAYLRAKEDYLMGINFSRLLTLKYGNTVSQFMGQDRSVLAVGRVMTCVLGMVVSREREIRAFVKTPFYKVNGVIAAAPSIVFDSEWKAVKGSRYENSPLLYKDNGFLKRETAEELIQALSQPEPVTAKLLSMEKKKEKKNPPLLFNLAELQNECSRLFKLSPDETLRIVQELYEKKLVTYPRTDARVLSTAVSKEIGKNIRGLLQIPGVKWAAEEILNQNRHQGLAKTRYVNDKQITDHYAIIPTGQGINVLGRLPELSVKVYERIVRRFLSIFFPAAVYEKVSLELSVKEEHFFAGVKVLAEEGYLKVAGVSKKQEQEDCKSPELFEALKKLKKGMELPVEKLEVKEGETSPPKRYASGSMILAMENAGQLIEDEELRAQIKGSGIGTSATRAEILKKLVNIKYLDLNKKTQAITPTLFGELVYEVVKASVSQLLNPELTASWEKGLTYVANGDITPKEYMDKLEGFIRRRTSSVTGVDYRQHLLHNFGVVRQFYKAGKQADGQTGKQTEKQAGKQMGGQTGKPSQGKAKKQSSKQKQGQP
ncbi:MAG: type IA DNA topoisomerase [Lachnospiraceae bacterium]|nr:type IA DNA topoisomerase [Lachnospiraceae bacterium]